MPELLANAGKKALQAGTSLRMDLINLREKIGSFSESEQAAAASEIFRKNCTMGRNLPKILATAIHGRKVQPGTA